MGGLPDPDWYFENVLVNARPGTSEVAEPLPVEQWRLWWANQTRLLASEWPTLAGQGFVLPAAGLARPTPQQLRTLLRKGVWTRAAHGIVSPVDIRGADRYLVRRRRHALAAAAVALRQSGHVVSGRSGGIVHGLPVFAVPARPAVTDPDRNGLGRNGAKHVHGAEVAAADVTDWYGVRVLRIPRTLVDLARHDRRDAIMAGDAALREKLTTPAEIDHYLDQAAGWPGVRQAREVLALLDPRAESPLESLARLVLHDDGFPPPDLQRWFGRDRVDMVFDEQRLIIEIDGLGKYRSTTPADEKRRERRLRRHGYRVERLTWDDVVVKWPETRQWLRPLFGLPV